MRRYTRRGVREGVMGPRFDGGRSPLGGPVKIGTNLAIAMCGVDDDDEIQLPGIPIVITVAAMRETLRRLNVDPVALRTMSVGEQQRVVRRVCRFCEAEITRRGGVPDSPGIKEQAIRVRGQLHRDLAPWSRGPLTLEHPQGSSYHHLVEYERVSGSTRDAVDDRNLQHIVVENNWARALAGKGADTGEVRMPFPEICWEFRVSGVRVMAFTVVEEDTTMMLLIYGRDKVWVSDDYAYELLGSGGLRGRPYRLVPMRSAVEFRRVADLIHAQIRASCILLDVRCVQRETVPAPRRLVERRLAERRAPPVDHVVVRLAPREEHHRRARDKGASTGGVQRAPQRGHLRRGCWVHYDDPDSGRVQYANDGGFFVSKSWREWHWSGDLSNMINKEYRL